MISCFIFTLSQLSRICQHLSHTSYQNKAHPTEGIAKLKPHNQVDPALDEVSAQKSKAFARMEHHKAT